MVSKGVIGLFILVLALVSVSAEGCIITSRNSCLSSSDNVVMGISGTTNAHGEMPNQGNYFYVLCCDFGTGDTNCVNGGKNKILGLSGITNAHAEIPSYSTYTNNICYDNIHCVNSDVGCSTPYFGALSLSGDTNAHIGAVGDYSTNICCCVPNCGTRQCGPAPNNCGGPDECGTCSTGACNPSSGLCVTANAYWANINNPRLAVNKLNIVPDNTQVSLILKNSGLSPGANVLFEVYEEDTITKDDEIRTGSNGIVGIADSKGDVFTSWLITSNDLKKTNDLTDFYFLANSHVSGNLELVVGGSCVGMNYCVNYPNQIMCEQDSCGVAEGSVKRDEPSITCKGDYTCECYWDITTNKCGPKWEASYSGGFCGNGLEEAGEECDDGNGIDNDGCSSTCMYEIIGPGVGCPEGTSLCTDGTCSLDCDSTDGGYTFNNNGICEAGEGCWGGDCTGSDGCASGLVCSLSDNACCSSVSDGKCNPYCSFVDPDCATTKITDLGVCHFDEDTNDDCGDGFLSYSWISYIKWPSDNIGWNTQSECMSATGGDTTNCVEFVSLIEGSFDNLWHYDPFVNSKNPLLTQCHQGSNIITCPAQIQLPFFGVYNIVSVISLIVAIYFLLVSNKKNHK